MKTVGSDGFNGAVGAAEVCAGVAGGSAGLPGACAQAVYTASRKTGQTRIRIALLLCFRSVSIDEENIRKTRKRPLQAARMRLVGVCEKVLNCLEQPGRALVLAYHDVHAHGLRHRLPQAIRV